MEEPGPPFRLTTAVALLIFNRPQTTRRVFDVIRQVRPRRLLVVADGPRPGRAGEAELCRAARSIIDSVDWDCEVLRNFSDSNLGCRRRVATGLAWVFDSVEEAIVLEDDCVPHPTFFPFCQELLERYRSDVRVMAISGDNFQLGRPRTRHSYYFSRYNHIWGWASWRRAWHHYDPDLTLWPEIRDERLLEDILEDPAAVAYWTRAFEAAYTGTIDSWDYHWTLTCWIRSGLTVLPSVNLVSNIGFDQNATHTVHDSRFAELPAEPMNFPLRHPPFVVRSARADSLTQKTMFSPPDLTTRILNRLRRL